jgi:hypothetical protein
MHSKNMFQAIGLALSGLLVAGTAYAADQKAPQVAEQSVTVQGVQVAIDPATGQLVAPTAAQRAALSRGMLERPSASGNLRSRGILDSSAAPADEAAARKTFHTFRLKNGHEAVGMALPESLMSSIVAERRADGSLNIHHQGDTNASGATEVTK